jgi:predicted phage terminase large subunit-like protein
VKQSLTRADVFAARRELARRGLIDFTRYTMRGYQPAPHHLMIADRLEAVERGEIDRLMIFMPPRHGKSELASRRFPAWLLGRDPTHQIIASSYNSDLATDFGREVREIVNSEEYQDVFPNVVLKTDERAANRWKTDGGGSYFAVGVGTAATGRGAQTFLIDDPFKDREEADSELRRDRVWNWYRSTAYTRLSPGGRVILINTRWHDDDLAGRLVEQMSRGGDQWEVLSLPAIGSDGQALWPEWYPLERLEAIKRTLGPREWSALYQQQPQPDEGTYFKREWFKNRWDALPTDLHFYMTSDHARSEGDGDYTVLRVWGYASSGDLYLVGGWRGQATADRWLAEGVIPLLRRYRVLCWFPENDATWGAVDPFVRRSLREHALAVRIEPLSTRGDKPTKAQSFQAMCSQGRVWLPLVPKPGCDGDEILAEYLRFPAGKHDDEVDAAAHMGRALDQAHPAIVKRVMSSNDPNDRYFRKRQANGDSWMVR